LIDHPDCRAGASVFTLTVPVEPSDRRTEIQSDIHKIAFLEKGYRRSGDATFIRLKDWSEIAHEAATEKGHWHVVLPLPPQIDRDY
jgi:hypothetical protein